MSEEGPAYLIDSDVLITAKHSYYAFSICPGFWDSLLHAYESARAHSLDRIRMEIMNGRPTDDLIQWVTTTVPSGFFSDSGSPAVVDSFTEIMLWITRHSQFTDAAKAKFASGADGWLVAYARVNGEVVVTNEQPEPNSKKSIKLPDVCNAFGVSLSNTFEMLQSLKVQYHFSDLL